MDEPDSSDPSETAAEARRIWTRLGVAGAALLAGVIAVALLAGGRPVGPGRGSYVAGTSNPLQAALPLLKAYVESSRGLRFDGRVKIAVADDSAMHRLSAVSAKSAPATDRAATLQALGLTAPTGAAVPAGSAYGSEAFYSYTDHTIYLRAGPFDAFHRAILVHELTVALDDQHFGLLQLTRRVAGNADQVRALQALTEGDATRVELGYVKTLSQADRQAVTAAHDYDPKATTYAQNAAAFPVTAGADFVTALVGRGGNGRVNAAFATPPRSTAQVLGPAAYLGDQQPYTMREPQVTGTVVDRGSLGQFGLAMVMTGGQRYRNVSVLAEVKGDSYVTTVTTKSGGRTCVTDAVLLPDDVSRDQLVRDMNAAGIPAQRSDIDNSLRFQRCR